MDGSIAMARTRTRTECKAELPTESGSEALLSPTEPSGRIIHEEYQEPASPGKGIRIQ